MARPATTGELASSSYTGTKSMPIASFCGASDRMEGSMGER